ncbi:MAG: hypothetical protein EPN93_01940 [Spirochaetes bacterium]|nr:MAG: hypothetical protein EPN93_01940 [Spirochaetota bacterium]
MARTSINVHTDIMRKLAQAALQLQTSRRDIVVRLLKTVMRDLPRYNTRFETVKYQPDDPEGRWHCFGVRFKAEEFEFWADLRRLSKFTVSYLVAIGVERYLDDLMRDGERSVHNYAPYDRHAVRRNVTDGMVIWNLIWKSTKPVKPVP